MYLSLGICPKKNAGEIIFFSHLPSEKEPKKHISPLQIDFSPQKNVLSPREIVHFTQSPRFWTEGISGATDKKSMSFQASFKQILREKMDQKPTSSSQNQSFQADVGSTNIAYLLGQIRRFETQIPRGQYPAPKIRPQRKPHSFSESQKHSYEFLRSCIHDLSEGFSSVELKKAFRQAAMILHPDQGGNTQEFMKLKDHYENLRRLVSI